MVFKSLFGEKSRPNSVSLGSPEAEGESTPSSSVYLPDVYEDYHDLIAQLSNEKFIIIGKKGSGKSAFAEYIDLKSQEEPNLFSKFIRGADCSLEKLVQLGDSSGNSVDAQSLFKWLIYTNILKLFLTNEAAKSSGKFEQLNQFLKKNSGYIEINEYEIKELVSKGGWEVSTDHFARFARAKMSKDVEIKSGKAHFSKLLPSLERVITSVLKSESDRENDNSYVIFFDDLDVGFHGQDQSSCDALVSLIRVARQINKEIFSKNGIDGKVVLLIRDDVETFLVNKYPDTAKIFSSYSVKVRWFQGASYSSGNEDSQFIKQFINKRIVYAFNKAGLSVNETDPWSSLVSDDIGFERSSFKYILNSTLFRPRDLLLFFKPIENGAYNFPISFHQYQNLATIYVDELAKEIKNELASFYNNNEIEMIFNSLGEMSKFRPNYAEAVDIVKNNCNSQRPEAVLEDLFDRSVIGNYDQNSDWYYFKYREEVGSSVQLTIDIKKQIVIQSGIRQYLANKY